MCGLVGMAGDLLKEDRLFFKNLLIASTLRGVDSTGIAAVDDKGTTQVFKMAVSAPDFVFSKPFDGVATAMSQVLIGHTRAATIGKINDDTAHPFDFGNTIGAHNGTLTSWYQLEDSQKYDVDSEALIYNLDKHGWDKTLPKIKGAWALTVYDQQKHELQILRNDHRPLWIAEKKDGSCIYWASETWMLKSLAERCGIQLGKRIYQPKENMLMTWRLPNRKFTKVFPQPQVRRVEIPEEEKIIAPIYPPYRRGEYQYPAQRVGAGSSTSGTGGCSTNGGLGVYPSGEKPSARYIGHRVAFAPIESSKSTTTSQTFLEGVLTQEPFCSVRVYMDKIASDKVLDDGRNMTGLCVAFAPGFGKEGEYLVVSTVSTDFVGPRKEKPDGNKAEKPVLPAGMWFEGPNGSVINYESFVEKTKGGCGNCSSVIEIDEEIEWVGDCPVCMNCIDAVKSII